MQVDFLEDEQKLKSLKSSLSEPRLARYIEEADGDIIKAIKLHDWNARLSQSLYVPMQMWEVSLRNRLNSFLIWKYGQKWPYDSRLRRNLKNNESRRLTETIDRQAQLRKIQNVPVDPIVADLSAGFWVGLLTKAYGVPFSWHYNLPRIFPNIEKGSQREDVSLICERLLDIRNRIAHHEPIYHRDLPDRWNDLQQILKGMCEGAFEYSVQSCSVEEVYASRP